MLLKERQAVYIKLAWKQMLSSGHRQNKTPASVALEEVKHRNKK